MTYDQTLHYLYSKLPAFHRIGAAAYKNNLDNTLAFCKALGNPEKKFKSVHIAGTNGKGSVSHILASIFQEAGYKTGLYSSPHLLDFRERIRMNGKMVPKKWVVSFVKKNEKLIQAIQPSFFEVTVAMAFDYFANNKVDIAIIETGLGGRLDSTNVISPVLSIITNISYDHQNLLGNTLTEIAAEKAGIIKENIPIVIGKHQPETDIVFKRQARKTHSKIYFAPDYYEPIEPVMEKGMLISWFMPKKKFIGHRYNSPLAGMYQLENIATVLQSVDILKNAGYIINLHQARAGLFNVKTNTGLRGRWEVLKKKPLIICDVAHNEAGLKQVFAQIESIKHEKLHIVFGMVKDKDVAKTITLLPKEAIYFFSQPDLPRALDVKELYEAATTSGLFGTSYTSVAEAYKAAISNASSNDIVLIVGSIFVVAEVLAVHHPVRHNSP